MLSKLKKIINGNNSIKEFCESVRQGIPSAVFGVNDAFKCLMLSAVDEKAVLVCKDNIEAKKCSNLLSQISNKKIELILPKEQNLTVLKAFSKDFTYGRIKAFNNLPSADIIVITIEALLQTCPKKIDKLVINKGENTAPDLAVKKLVSLGYKRVDALESKGTFSLRGDILDVYAINHELPIRIDFFGDDVEAVKHIDLDSRKTISVEQSVEILQAQEFIFDGEIDAIKSAIRSELKSCKDQVHDQLSKLCDDLYFAIETFDLDTLQIFSSLSKNAGYFFHLIEQNSLIVFDSPKASYDYAKLLTEEFGERFKSYFNAGETLSFTRASLLSLEELNDYLKSHNLSCMQALQTAIPFFNPLKIINPEVSGIVNYQLDFNELFLDIDNWLFGGYNVLLCTGDNKRSNTLNFDLSAKGILSAVTNADELNSGVTICDKTLDGGFIFHEEKLVVIGSSNLYRRQTEKIKTRQKKSSFFTAPEAGDYCVHEIHGVGKVLGLNKISTTEGTKDYITIEYSGGDILHIPVEQLDILSRYLGAEKRPKLSRIGGQDFERIKKAVKESIKKMSFDLKKLYAERNAKVGYQFSEFKDLEEEFKKDFQFEETPDQLLADKAIKEDMLSPTVMDRLICGDVGFGKTEVAFKAIFRAIVNGKQAVLLAPTTILVEQHYQTAKERFKRFGVKIACLNRFRTSKEVKNILEKLKNGQIDLIIGTHRLLSKDVAFHDLGLLVLDEEQRFGVEHKEKIKLLKANVDTLTLTATPIPRTLNMSLSGIRPISVIATPPKLRLPVQIYVTEETPSLIKDGITREVNRGGQVFVLYNRVESIYNFAQNLQALLPNVKIAVCHGQMDEKILENKIMDFYGGKYDVLVSTTIIENGIDLPKANTLIVIDADRLGLSSLYQLKGRVGRSDRLAYAYFTFKRDKILTKNAYERLNTIIEFTDMGSGIKVAMRDLEIRGAGNILGAEQHGHMEKVGYELYSKLLREEIAGEEEIVPELDVRISAFIPENYVESKSTRMSCYKEIAEIETDADALEIKEYLKDAFGKIPSETLNLIEISLIKRLAMKLTAKKVEVSKQNVALTFNNFMAFRNPKLLEKIDCNKDLVIISMDQEPCLKFRRTKKTNVEMLMEVKNFLESVINS